MAKFLHGTSFESAQNIILNHKLGDSHTIWNCSRNDMLYMRDAEDEDAEYLCIESGKIAAAYTNSQSNCIALLCIEIPDELVEEFVEEDDSCDNMYGCFQILYSDLNKHIASNQFKLTISIFEDSYIPYLRPFYLTNISEEYMSISDVMLKEAINILKKNDNYIEELWYIGEKINTYDFNNDKYIEE